MSACAAPTSCIRSVLSSVHRLLSLTQPSTCRHDDSAALRELARQLHGSAGTQQPDDGEQPAGRPGGPSSFSESIAELRRALQATSGARVGSRQSGRPIVIVLDEFDQFASRTRQMLLYNLFNLIQSVGTRVAVVGVTACFDALDHLEKRSAFHTTPPNAA